MCTLREDVKKGVYVEGNIEEIVTSPLDALQVYERGSRNRHVAETSMNLESSRSHAVFTIVIRAETYESGLKECRESRFNLVDLAGSERQSLTGTVGTRLKEAGSINRSLLTLSNVINALVERGSGKDRHVHYRDSKLTFLLRDSLGGNSKTCIIATVNPVHEFKAETLSTLRFAQSAKQIKNRVTINKDVSGDSKSLSAEVIKLRQEISSLKAKHGFDIQQSEFERLYTEMCHKIYFLEERLEYKSQMISRLEELCYIKTDTKTGNIILPQKLLSHYKRSIMQTSYEENMQVDSFLLVF